MTPFSINPDITQAETLPASFYRSQEVFDLLIEKVFAQTWQFAGDTTKVALSQQIHPFSFLEFGLEEPMLLTNVDGELSCISNVCTHRGNILCHSPGKSRQITCTYHGRRFNLQGEFQHMPQFKEALNFPRKADDLTRFPLLQWGPWLFTALTEDMDFQAILDAMNRKVGFLPLHDFKEDKSRNKDYLVNTHWALYCDNYLEGFHIPFVHDSLNAVLDYSQYETVLYPKANLQIGHSSGGEHIFDFPADHEDYGKQISAYYFWIFPNMMFNFYPWGCSINIVKPIALNRTKVSFITYVYDESKLDIGAGAALDKVEREDEFVVEGVFKGMNSRVYQTGRFSPQMEKGVHHFHSLLAQYLK
ncbi:MAG: SRPBCC family protein [Algoriphagus sp.]|uniref:aromatic ring-hydroxylating oxygenase subunit alpha n=1 Tax=Algoriphagus sp. TaxID=1872435 RepID=UPI00272FCD0F|nr:SRPBCC family protein [Algoriphagus sp.]MDP2042339.1 SRPBCC family protein [Algoriphagus sp.]MDP3473094.1 SRPBCC family protein [Algoriphagus sp.]